MFIYASLPVSNPTFFAAFYSSYFAMSSNGSSSLNRAEPVSASNYSAVGALLKSDESLSTGL